MPIYEYACSACGHRFEKLVRSGRSGQPKITCPECHKDIAERVLSSFAVRGKAPSSLPGESAPVGGG